MAMQTMKPLVVDLSHHNEVDDWKKVYEFGIRGIIHKASQGTGMVDKTYAPRRQAARDAGLLWGAYHFADNSDVAKQVEHFLDAAKPDDNTLLALDWEPNGARTMSVMQAEVFLRMVFEKTGQRPVLYSGNLIKEQLGNKGNVVFANHRLWLAQYGPKAVLPAGFKSYWLWQYSGDGVNGSGIIPGIKTKGIDCNVFGGKDLAAEWVDRDTPIAVADAAPAPVAPLPTILPGPSIIARPVPVSFPPTPGQATVKSLRPFSRKLLLLKWGKRIAAFFGLSVGSDITLQQAVDQSQGVAHVFQTLITNPALIATVSVSVAIVAVCAVLELYHVDGYNSGDGSSEQSG